MIDLNTFFATRTSDIERLPVEEETSLVLAARDGDSDAFERLLVQYGPLLRASARNATGEDGNGLDADEARSVTLVAFSEYVLEEHKIERGSLAQGRLQGKLMESLSSARKSTGAFYIKDDEYKRYTVLMTRAENDLNRALALIEAIPPADRKISAAKVTDMYFALNSTTSLVSQDDDGNETERHGMILGAAPHASENDEIAIAIAFDAVNEVETQVIHRSYGFEPFYEPQTDVEAAYELGQLGVQYGRSPRWTRSKVDRTRAEALHKMHDALRKASA